MGSSGLVMVLNDRVINFRMKVRLQKMRDFFEKMGLAGFLATNSQHPDLFEKMLYLRVG